MIRSAPGGTTSTRAEGASRRHEPQPPLGAHSRVPNVHAGSRRRSVRRIGLASRTPTGQSGRGKLSGRDALCGLLRSGRRCAHDLFDHRALRGIHKFEAHAEWVAVVRLLHFTVLV